MRGMVDKRRLAEHLARCSRLAELRNETRLAEVLRNLEREIRSGQFDPDEKGGTRP